MGNRDRDLIGAPDSADGVKPAHFLFNFYDRVGVLLIQEGLVALGADRTECHGVNPNAKRSVLHRKRPSQPFGRLAVTYGMHPGTARRA